MDLKKYIAELERRNVFKSGIAYLVIAWMIVQVASIILPIFNVPDYLMKALVKILIVGFPLWLVFSWVYDITSKGIIKTSKNIDSQPSQIDTKVGQRLNTIIIVSLSIAVILLLFNQFRSKYLYESRNGLNDDKISNVIAVLPFLNNKPDPESDYFGFAMADQIIGDLSYLNNITVRPSSSVRKYDKKVIDPNIVKEDLNVDYILTGNYLKEGNLVRLNIELVDLKTNEMIWRSDKMEVDFNNTFELQDIVSEKVVKGLNIRFSEKEINRIGRNIPNDPLAYEYYLRSLSYPLSGDGDQMAIEMLNKSIALDSVYAPAFAELGFRIQRLAFFEMMDSDKFNRAEQNYNKALDLNPELLSALGYLAILYTENDRTEEAIEITRKMLEINSNNAAAHFSLGYIYRYTGMLHESVEEMEKALEIDPKNPNYGRIGVSYLQINEFDKAFKAFSLGKETSYVLVWQAGTLFRKGDYKGAVELYDRVIERNNEPYILNFCIAAKAFIEGDIETGLQATKRIEEANLGDSEGWYYLSTNYAILGDKSGSIRCLQKAVDKGYYNYPFMNADPQLELIRGTQEFNLILEKAKEKHLYFKNKFF